MSQANSQIPSNQSGVDYRSQDNAGKKAILNHHKGSTAPDYAEAGIIWLDDASTPWLLKTHDGSDWITLASVDASTKLVEAYHGNAPLRLINSATDSGSANTYAVNPAPPITSYVTGQIVTLKPNNANSGASTLNVNSLGAKSIKTTAGADPSAGMLATTGTYILAYDGTNFVLLNPTVTLGTAAALNVGTSANQVVQLDGSARLPAVNGSLLTNIAGLPVLSSGKIVIGALTIQYGTTTSASTSTVVTFPTAFGGTPYNIQATFETTNNDNQSIRISAYNATQMTVNFTSSTAVVFWLAIGPT